MLKCQQLLTYNIYKKFYNLGARYETRQLHEKYVHTVFDLKSSLFKFFKIIRIHHECEGWIEKSVIASQGLQSDDKR